MKFQGSQLAPGMRVVGIYTALGFAPFTTLVVITTKDNWAVAGYEYEVLPDVASYAARGAARDAQGDDRLTLDDITEKPEPTPVITHVHGKRVLCDCGNKLPWGHEVACMECALADDDARRNWWPGNGMTPDE